MLEDSAVTYLDLHIGWIMKNHNFVGEGYADFALHMNKAILFHFCQKVDERKLVLTYDLEIEE